MNSRLPERTDGAPFLSACLIVRDEEKFLDRCLSSLAGIVDEICVLDTGSMDGTLGIARRHGARIGERPWDDDFSAARNASLDLARGEWILQIDADEELVPPTGEWKSRLRGSRACFLVELDLRSSKGPSERTWQPRLFRRDPRLRYERALHETILDNLADAGLPAPEPIPLLLIHHGYLDEVVSERGKFERNLRILRACRDRGRADAYDLFKLAAALEGAGDQPPDEIAGSWTSCLELGMRETGSRRAEWPWWPRAVRGAAIDLWCRGRLADARDLLDARLEEAPSDTTLRRTLAELELAIGDHASALEQLPPSPDSVRIRGRCLLAAGRFEAALQVLASEDRHAALAARALLRLGRSEEAVAFLSKAIPSVGEDAEAAFDVAIALRELGEAETAEAFLRRPLRGSRIALARCAGLLPDRSAPGGDAVPLDIESATDSVFQAAVGGAAEPRLDRAFSRKAILDGLADRLESHLVAGDESTVLAFARGAAAWEPVVPGISRLVEGA